VGEVGVDQADYAGEQREGRDHEEAVVEGVVPDIEGRGFGDGVKGAEEGGKGDEGPG